MVKEELIQRSPVRIFMEALNGGLKAGELGVIASPTGIGKTSVLVQIALNKLLQGQKVIHVSFTKHADHVLAWYEDIFNEFIKKKNLEHKQDVKDEIVKNRVLMKFNQEGLTVDQILKSLRAMIKDGGFAAESLIVDGYHFSAQDKEKISKIRDFACELNLSVWFSCTVKEEPYYDDKNIPVIIRDYSDLFDAIVVLEPKQDHIELALPRVRKAYNPEHKALRLDPKTLLILEEEAK